MLLFSYAGILRIAKVTLFITLSFSVSSAMKLSIAVGSANPVKMGAAKAGLMNILQLGEDMLDMHGFNVASGVPDQPLGNEETKQGAINRAKAAHAAYQAEHNAAPTYSIGLEGGIQYSENDQAECFAWIVAYNGEKYGSAKTATFTLPKAMIDLVKQGIELGYADDQVFSTVNSKQGKGTVGHLTKGVMDRTEYYTTAMTLAMIPFLWPELYPADCN
jgi:inosine/xanthosine triphosphatase